MTAVPLVARRRLILRWRGLVAAGILLGLGFGLCLTSLAAARTTASAHDRILAAADAPDAAVAHGLPLEESEASLRTIPQITAQRVYTGFRGVAVGVDPALTTGLIAPAQARFPVDLPVLSAGRLPDPDRPDEVFINETAARAADLEVGQQLRFAFFLPGTSRSAETTVTLVGIGTVGYAVLLAVAIHALWAGARANRHDLAVLRAVGCTSRQLHSVTAWQALPVALLFWSGPPSGSQSAAGCSRCSPTRWPSSTPPRRPWSPPAPC